MNSRRSGAIIPSSGGAMTPQQIQSVAIEVIDESDRRDYMPRVNALCQRQDVKGVMQLLDHYVGTEVRNAYLALDAHRQMEAREQFERMNSLWYSQFKPQMVMVAQAINENTEELRLSTRATVSNTIEVRASTAEMAELRRAVQDLTVVTESHSDTLRRQGQQARSLPVHIPQDTTHHHVYHGLGWGLDVICWGLSAAILTVILVGLAAPWRYFGPVVVPTYQAPVPAAPPPASPQDAPMEPPSMGPMEGTEGI